MLRECNLGQALILCDWSQNARWLGLHMFDCGDVMAMNRAENGEWYPVRAPTDEDIDSLLRVEAVPDLDYGRPSLLDRLRGHNMRKPLSDLRCQLANLIERKRKNLHRLELALVRAWNH